MGNQETKGGQGATLCHLGDTGDQAHLVSLRGSTVTDSSLLTSCVLLSSLVLKHCLFDGSCGMLSTGIWKGELR